MFDLNNKVILVVGGRGYLGRHFCQKLRSQGGQIISADMQAPSNAASKSDFKTEFDDIDQIDIDVTNTESIATVVQSVMDKYGRIDVLIYSVTAKPEDFYAPFTECSLQGWQKVFSAEMDGLFLVTQQVGQVMEKAKRGNIILLSSIYGVVGNDQRIYEGANLSTLYAGKNLHAGKIQRLYSHAAYPAVKGGVISLARYLAAYWEGQNIRVNCISPGGVEHSGENQKFVEQYSSHVPLGRKAKIDEISGPIVFLASDESSYVNGHNLIVDGGWTAW